MDHREEYLDTACGILLIHMMAFHCWLWAGLPHDALWLNAFGFFMPWFFFKGGMFYRSRPIWNVVKTGWRRLMIPYIVFTLIGSVVLWVHMILEGKFNGLHTVLSSFRSIAISGAAPGNLVLWFLFSLFVVRILFAVIQTRRSRNALWLIIALPILFHLFNGKVGVTFPLYFSNILSGLAFYALGFLLKDFKPSVLLFTGFFLVYISSVYFFPQTADMRTDTVRSGCYIGWITMSLVGIIVIDYLCRTFLNFKNPFSWVGKNSMPFYCWHWIVMEAITYFPAVADLSPQSYFILQLIIMAIALPALYFLQLRFEKLLHKT